MLPSEDAQWVGAELTRRFGMPLWSFTLSVTDANRWALRLARLATGKSKIRFDTYLHHGWLDDTFAVPKPSPTEAPSRAPAMSLPRSRWI